MKSENRTKNSISLPELKDVRIPELNYPWPNSNSLFSDQLGIEVQDWLENDLIFFHQMYYIFLKNNIYMSLQQE
ncbi:hypothetical protein [Chryseobacterium oranimense]|uniref:hypothetical protein n=1 Tax=Chryseobacterium oranimense TaxID=421058 RepID=UPI0022364A03|nr:hypothetical protein [Chryseobacterium oranimense]